MSIGIVGLGYVGLPLAVAFTEAGEDVVGLDVDEGRIGMLADGVSYVEDISDSRVAEMGDRFAATMEWDDLAAVDTILICVPTPLTPNREPDLSALEAAGCAIAGILRAGHTVVLESTTYPGTTRERLLPLLEESGLVAGDHFHLAFSPERVDPGRINYGLRNTPKVLGGLTDACLSAASHEYAKVCDHLVPVSTPEAAELSKLLENVFRSVNIALVNELAMLCDRMGIDVWEVIDAAATKPYGFMRFEPGPGMGGHCLPVDPFYLAWRARQFDMSTEFIELAGKVNQQMPYYCVERIIRSLNAQGQSAKGAKVALLGVAYKPGVGDIRESPAIKILTLLRGHQSEVVYHDPYVPELAEHSLSSLSLDEALRDSSLAVIITAHPEIDLDTVVAAGGDILDLRGVTRDSHADVERL